MDLIYRLGQASAGDICGLLSDPPTCTTVRGLLRVLERKGHVRHQRMGRQYIYLPVVSKDAVALSHLQQVVGTFFHGSTARAVAALLASNSKPFTPLDLARLKRLLEVDSGSLPHATALDYLP
jgi:BlaI family transcriptional regulator, penicillinase repressor